MTDPRRARSVVEASSPLEHYLLPVPSVGDDVCSVCHGPVAATYHLCYPCNEARRWLGQLSLDGVAFISLAPRREQMARDLTTYKHSRVPSHLREARAAGLAATLWRWLARHEHCLAFAAGSSGYHLITTVPSTCGRTSEHPLTRVVGKLVADTVDRSRHVLRLARTDLEPRTHAPDRFSASTEVNGRDILLVDDTWTTGGENAVGERSPEERWSAPSWWRRDRPLDQ